MRNVTLCLFLLVFSCLSLPATEGVGYFFNPRISSRAIALNEMVRVTFSTMPIQVRGVDVEQSVLRSLQAGQDGRNWRLLNAPLITIHEKGNDVEITMELLPRRSGDLALPQLDLPWLEGTHRTNFGSIRVENRVDLAPADTAAAPVEVDGIAGFTWGQDIQLVAQRLNQSVDPQTKNIELSEQLRLNFPAGALAKATLITQGINLRDSRPQLVQRWGTPIRTTISDDGGTLEWSLGWVWITAEQDGADLKVEIANEQIIQQAADIFLKQQLFAPLDQDQAVKEGTAAAVAEPAGATTAGAQTAEVETTKPAPAPEPTGLTDEDIEAELERNLGQSLE